MESLSPIKNNRRNNQGYALLTSLLIVVLLGIILGTAMIKANAQLKVIRQRQALQEAFYAAEAGLERSIFELRIDPLWRPGENGYPPVQKMTLNRIPGDDTSTIGYYSLEISEGEMLSGWNTLWVRSQGQDVQQNVTRVIVARLLIDNPSRFLVSTLGDLRIGSGADVDADILGQDIFFEANESLGSPERDIMVNGDVYFLRSISGEDNPAVHISPDSQVQKFPSITFVGVDLNRYREIASGLVGSGEGIVADGNLTVDLSKLDMLAENTGQGGVPKIIFAEGDVTIKGQYDTSLLVVAGGNIYINGSVEPDNSIDSNDRPQMGLFADKDVIISEDVETNGGDLSVEAFIIADGEGDAAEGKFTAQGSSFSQGTLTFTGAISVRGEGRTAVDLNVFNTRNYNFNSELTNQRKIPFSPFIVNIINWHEATLHDPFPPASS
jgi:hypothetical protein